MNHTTKDTSEWFADWFDSPYYHQLYKHRDFAEAARFIANLVHELQLPEETVALDLGCGKGRHAFELSKHYNSIIGLDLSPASIQHAAKEYPNVEFMVGDMRIPFGINQYDAVFNLFTSFGYFQDSGQNTEVLKNVQQSLRPGGIFVQDYLNEEWVRNGLIEHETKEVDGISFEIKRSIANKYVIKDIQFKDNGEVFHFQEKVQLISKNEFEDWYQLAGLRVLNTFGDYNLGEFDLNSSPRLIFICKKHA